MEISLQRLGDNPRDHDGVFSGFQPGAADVNGIRPDADLRSAEEPSNSPSHPDPLPAWKIYPAPPPAHWHWQGLDGQNHAVMGEGGEGVDQSKRSEKGEIQGVPVDLGGKRQQQVLEDARATNGSEGFVFEDCEIPGEDEKGFQFGFNEEGVYEVYDKSGGQGEQHCPLITD